MKRLYLLLFAFVAAWSASANPIDRQQARQQAEKFLESKGIVISEEAAARSLTHNAMTSQSLYVFNTAGNHGFVIVAGDDRFEPIIGYTTQGRFDESDLPVNFKAWLEQAAAEIEAAGKRPAQALPASSPKATISPVRIHNAIQQLIITSWNQGNTDNVYNSHLPLVEGKRPCTGCVATVGAQVMYYYHKDLPIVTQPVPGYKLTDGNGNDASHGANTSADLPAIQFKWDLMKTKYSYKEPDAPNSEEEDAVADLMLYCGYAAHMNFGLADKHGGSSASISTLADGFSKYFGFNPTTWKTVTRSYYSISEWDEIIYNELACGRPVIYSGSYDGGHAFICDGYDGAGLYHFNWGWGGSYNGYFKLQATNPKGDSDISDMGYIADNYCIIGLQPNKWPDIYDPSSDDAWEVIEVEGFVPTIRSFSIDNTTLSISLWNKSDNDYGFGFALGELGDNGSIQVIDTKYESQQDNVLKGWYYRSLSFDVSTYGLSEGTHKLVPLNKLKGETVWKMCTPTDSYYEVIVSGGDYSIIAHPIEDLKVNEFHLATGGTPGYSQGINLSVTNNGDNLEKELYVYVGTAEDFGKYSGYQKVRIAAGNTKEYRLSISKLDPGQYTLRLVNGYNSNEVLAQEEITISQDLQATNFEVTGKKYANKTLRVDATVENHAGDYAVPLYLFASTGSTKQFVYAAGSAIERGSSEVVTFYFQPNKAGLWNLWIATDKNGGNIIGQSTVEVAESHSANLSVSSEVQKLSGQTIQAEKMVVNVDVTNNGSYAYDDVIEVCLYKELEDNTGIQVDLQKQEILLEPSAKTSLKFTFDNLEDGAGYFYYIYYYSTENSQNKRYRVSNYPAGYLLHFKYTPDVILFADANVKALCVANWDTNGNGELSEVEAAAVTNLGEVFKGNNDIVSFDELVYFTGLNSINDEAFWKCKNLASIKIPANVNRIGSWAFLDCYKLSTLSLSAAVTEIGWAAFSGCQGLVAISVADENPKYDSRANCNAIIETATNKLIRGCQNTFIPESVTAIDGNAFEGCETLTAISIPESVISIGGRAFAGCRQLESANIPSGITVIEESLFRYCDKLTSINIPEGVTEIGIFAFDGCSSLTSITLPAGLEKIEPMAFFCSNLTSVTVGMLTPIALTDGNDFGNHENATLYVPAGCKAAYEAADYWKDFKEIVEIPAIKVNDLSICKGGKNKLHVFMDNEEEITAFQFDVEVPRGVTVTDVQFGNRKSDNHTVDFSEQPDGCYRVVGVSLQSAPFSGNEGELVSIMLSADKDIEEGDYGIGIKNIVLTSLSKGKFYPVDANSILTVLNQKQGDADGDGVVDVADIVAMVNYILNISTSGFVFLAADINADGEVDVFDVMLGINLVLNRENAAGSMARATDTGGCLEPMYMITTDDNIRLEIADAGKFTAFQFDVEVPEGTELTDVVLTGSEDTHINRFDRIGENSYRVMAVSLENNPLRTTTQGLLRLTLSGDSRFAVIDNIKFVTTQGESVLFAVSQKESATGIKEIGTRKDDVIYNISGSRVNAARENLPKGTYIINNTKVIIK
jgi:hypothetical protein